MLTLYFRKSVQWKSNCSMRADGRTDRQIDVRKLIVSFRNFVNAPKKVDLRNVTKLISQTEHGDGQKHG